MSEKKKYRIYPRGYTCQFIRRPFRYASVMDRIALQKMGLRGLDMDKVAALERLKKRIGKI